MVSGQNPAQQQLTKAIHEEEVNGDLQEAIALYEGIVASYPDDRKAVAESLYRIGLSHEKLGNREAGKYYQNVISNYSDQSVEAQMSRERLRAMQASMATGSRSSTISLEKLFETEKFYGNVSNDGRYATFTDWTDANLYYVDMVTNTRKPVTTEGHWYNPMSFADYGIWSPDNTKIAYAWYEEKNTGYLGVYKIIIWELETGKSRVVTEIADGFIFPVEWTSNSRQLLTIGGNKETLSIGLLDLKTEAHSIYKQFARPGFDLFQGLPSISPDSKYILVNQKTSEKNRDIYVISTEDHTETLISSHSADEWGLKWCRDNKAFLFASDRSGNPAIYKMPMKNGVPVGDPTLIYEGITHSYRPLVASDDDRLIYSNSHTMADIYVSDVNLNKGVIENKTVLFEEASHLFHPVWSNSGDKIALIRRNFDKGGNDDLLIRNMINGEEKVVDIGVRIELHGAFPCWSQDDSKIVMEYQIGGGFNLTVVDVQNETAKKIENIGRPAIFGTSNSIISGGRFARHIIRMDLETNKIDTVFTGNPQTGFAGLSISPDQKYMSFWDNPTILTLLNLKSLKSEVIWECGPNNSFYKRSSRWLSDNETLVVVLKNIDENGQSTKSQLYTINIHTQEKIAGPVLKESELQQGSTFNLNPTGDKLVLRKSTDKTNVWRIKY